MNRAAAVFLGVLAAGAAAAILRPGAAIRPGRLRPAHESLADDCLACHEPLAGVRRERCAACHDPDGIGVRLAGGAPAPSPRESVAALHRRLGEAECAACHAEHAGRLEGGPAARFEHSLLPDDIRAACADCHGGRRPADALHAGAGDGCAACHAVTGWRPATFDHRRNFRFDGDHPARCADCHEPGKGFAAYSCFGCHEHGPAAIERKHRKEGIAEWERCADCHRGGEGVEARRPGGGEGGRRGGRERGRGR